MTTSIAQELIDEYVAEVKEHLDDDKNIILRDQGFSLFGTAQKIFNLAIKSFSVLGFILLFLLVGSLGEANLQALMSASVSEMASIIKSTLNLFIYIWFTSLLFSVGICYHYYFRNIKQERLNLEKDKLEEIRLMVVVCEELLLRHKLINKEGVDHG